MKTEFVEKALKKWLPAPKEFDSFAREEKGPPEENGKANTKDTAAKSQKRYSCMSTVLNTPWLFIWLCNS